MRSLNRKRRRARRYMPKRRNRGLISWPMLAVLATILVVAGTAALIESRRGQEEVAGFVDYARSQQGDPVRLIVSAARSHRVLFLGDVHPSAEPKRIAAAAIEALAHGPGLDVVALEVGADQQPIIDTYLASDPEDISILTRSPRTLNEQWGVPGEYLEIYRRVWRLNRALGPGRQIRILAADLPGWPPEAAARPQAIAAQYAQRDAHMAELIETEVLAVSPRARMLIFMGSYHGLKSGQAELRFGGGPPIPVTWLATRLRQLHPGEVYSIIVDGSVRPELGGTVGTYAASRISDLLRKHMPEATSPFGLRVDDRFDFVRDPIRIGSAPGLDLVIRPDDYRLQDVVDGYIFLGAAHSIGTRQ